MISGAAYGTDVEYDALFGLRFLVQHLSKRQLAPAGRPGGEVSRRRGRGLETMDVRLYADGDDIRHIDRNATARTGETHVRNFHDEREKLVLLAADFRPAMLWGTRRALRSVAAAEALSLIGWRTVEDGGRVGMVALGGAVPEVVSARGRERGMLRVIGGLVRAHRAALDAATQSAAPDGGLERLIEIAARLAPTGSTICLATGLDDPGPSFSNLARALTRRARLNVLLVRDRFETAAPTGSYPVLGPRGRPGWLNVAGRGQRSDGRAGHLRELGAEVTEIGADLLPEAMAAALEQALEIGGLSHV